MNFRGKISMILLSFLIGLLFAIIESNLFGWLAARNPFPIWLIGEVSQQTRLGILLVHDGVIAILLASPFAFLIWRISSGEPWQHVLIATTAFGLFLYSDFFPTSNWYVIGVSIINIASLALATLAVRAVASRRSQIAA